MYGKENAKTVVICKGIENFFWTLSMELSKRLKLVTVHI